MFERLKWRVSSFKERGIHQVYVSIGGNVDPQHYIRRCLDALFDQYADVTTSSAYQCDAVGFEGDPFLNLVAGFKTDESLTGLHGALKALEDDNGRDRDQPKFSSRTLDIDILTYDDLHGDFEEMSLPHADILACAYVLGPLAEVAPDLIVPGTELTALQCWQTSSIKINTIEQMEFYWRDQALPLGSLEA